MDGADEIDASLAMIKFSDESKLIVRQKSIVDIKGSVSGRQILDRHGRVLDDLTRLGVAQRALGSGTVMRASYAGSGATCRSAKSALHWLRTLPRS